MDSYRRLTSWLRPAFYLGHNPITLAGAVLTTSSAITLLSFWVFEIVRGGPIHPYTGIVFFLILPGFFVAGLVLMPVGALWRRRKLRVRGVLPAEYPQIDLRKPLLRRAFAWVAGLTFLNVAILGTASYRGVEYMDSVQFCGQTCHTVMQPEFTAYQNSPHSRVACVDCHIGAGASWFVRSKLSGVRQVFAVTLKTYSQPIPSPVRELRPARETCEQCHWPQRFAGDRFLVRTKYSEDEKNTPLYTVLVMKIGGHTWQGKVGIHGRHLDAVERITYLATDERRQVIPRVSYVDDSGKTVEFTASDANLSPQDVARGEQRKMDCIDCHNRPTHAFEMPDRAVDKALSAGSISVQLPYIKKKALEVLQGGYSDRERARLYIAAELRDFYRKNYPEVYLKERALVEAATEQVVAIYLRNIFPEMKLSWGVHPNNIGHMDFPGCFRCHDGSHVSTDGRVINADCSACHNILAMEDPNPKILTDLGLKQ